MNAPAEPPAAKAGDDANNHQSNPDVAHSAQGDSNPLVGSKDDNVEEGSDAGDVEEEDEEDEEPRLKYTYLTKHLGSVYRNGDATSCFVSAGDKMVGSLVGLRVISAKKC